jgi:hypothetical protein
VQQIENPIKSQEQDVMSRYVLNILVFGDHIQLGQNGQGLQPNGKCPEYTVDGEFRMHDEGQAKGEEIQPVVWERVRLCVVTLFIIYLLLT